jgi:Uma2 family endonuclease
MTPTEPATAAPKKLMTVDEYWEFCQRPENADRRTELIRGEVVEMSKPTRLHAIVANNIAYVLETYARSVGRGYVASETGVVLDDDPGSVVGPDTAYFTDANTYDEVHPKWGEELPVLVVEVLSPNDKMKQVTQKITDYLDSGVPVVWLVNYEERFLTVYRRDQTPRVADESADVTVDEMPGFACKVLEFFLLPRERLAVQPTAPVPPTA